MIENDSISQVTWPIEEDVYDRQLQRDIQGGSPDTLLSTQ